MDYHISDHAKESIQERGIPLHVIDTVLNSPQQIVPSRAGRKVYQSVFTVYNKPFLIRVIVVDTITPVEVITAMRTSKIDKYWVTEDTEEEKSS